MRPVPRTPRRRHHRAAPIPAVNPNDYADEKNWLCRPGRKGDACDVDLTTTVVAADGTLTRETWAANPKAPIDCFYVYPTVSTDTGAYSDMTADPAETNVIHQQFARFGSKCRTFAPMYRQLTLAGLRQRLSGGTVSFDKGVQYDDVRDAWRSYLQRDNGGRGFVLIGHSQGAYILTELLKQEIDGKPIQKQLVGAYILGATFPVAKGKDAGGALQNIPLCRKPGQIGCVVNFSAFRSTVPPPANTLVRQGRRSRALGLVHEPRDARRGQRAAPCLSLCDGQDHRDARRDTDVGDRQDRGHAVCQRARAC